MPNETTALAPFNPSTLAEAVTMAEMLSKASIIPTPLKGKPSDVLVILLHGRELGISPMTALSEIYVVEGKPAASAALKVGLCKAKPTVCEYFRMVESTEKRATFETKRAGDPEPTRLTWTIEQAARANLLGKTNWKGYPEAMLRSRCESALASLVYPDLVKGLSTQDELEEVKEKELNPPPPQSETLKEKAKEKLKKTAKPPETVEGHVKTETKESAAPVEQKTEPAPTQEPEKQPDVLRARAAKLWKEALAAGWSLEKFQSWVAEQTGNLGPSSGWSIQELTKLEEEWARQGVVEDEPGSDG